MLGSNGGRRKGGFRKFSLASTHTNGGSGELTQTEESIATEFTGGLDSCKLFLWFWDMVKKRECHTLVGMSKIETGPDHS